MKNERRCKIHKIHKKLLHQSHLHHITIFHFLTLNYAIIQWTDRCDMPLGLQSLKVPNQRTRASSYSSHHYGPWSARLHNRYAWYARKNDRKQWLQVDFGTSTRVTRVVTQGRQNGVQWVKTYYVSYSTNGQSFRTYKEQGRTKVRNVICRWFSWDFVPNG